MLTLHANVCPDCGAIDSGHLLDPPPHCPHEYERFVPVKFYALPADRERAVEDVAEALARDDGNEMVFLGDLAEITDAARRYRGVYEEKARAAIRAFAGPGYLEEGSERG